MPMCGRSGFKCAIVALPFACILVDVSSWYIIKLFHPFVYVEMLAGMTMAGCFAVMFFVTLYQLWFSPPPTMVVERERVDIPSVG